MILKLNLLFLIFKLIFAEKEDNNEKIDLYRVDHEAFLGPDIAKDFESYSTDKSKEKLLKIVNKIDIDKDGFVSLKELEKWIEHVQKNYISNDVEKNWKIHNPANLTKLSWNEYRDVTYSFIDNLDNGIGDEDLKKYKKAEIKDKKRWFKADQDGDKLLSKLEFADFLHPELNEKLNDIIVEETLEDIDINQDGKISLKEYINDIYQDNPKHEPDWVDFERKQFAEVRDKNKDGFLDIEEVKEWLIPEKTHSEAEHLMQVSDENKDGKLSKTEIINNYDHFVGSEVTDYGQALINQHDEL